MRYRFLLFPLLLLALAGCGGTVPASVTPLPTQVAAQSLVTATQPATQTANVPPTAQPSPAATHTVSPEPTQTPVPLATSTAVPAPTNTPLPESTVDSVAPIAEVQSGANLRAGPGTAYEIIGEIKSGQTVLLKARNAEGDWIQLDMEGEGQTWIASFLLELPAGLDLSIATDFQPPPPPPTPGDVVNIVESTITIPTYPWYEYTTKAFDEDTNWEYRYFDRQAYEASVHRPTQQTYRLVVLENQWLRLTLMPDLGGRLYQMIFKPTGSNELYQNPVIKPSPWGPGPEGNGWLAAGGIEWGLPVIEHGYAWSERWGYITEPVPPAGAVTVFDQAQEQIHLNVDVGLEPDSAAFTLDFTFENRGDNLVDASFWLDAMLAPGPDNQVGPDLHFLIPGSVKQVHSTGESDLPGDSGLFDWPVYNGRDVSRLGTWQRWLGFFAHPRAQANWAAVYDTSADEGVVRIFPPEKMPGLKGFGLGWSQAIDPANYTDDGSAYVELQGGLTPTFSEPLSLRPGRSLTWQESWYPVAGIGGISAADDEGAVHLTSGTDGLRLRIFSTSTREGELSVTDATGELLRFKTTLDPANPADILLPPSQLPIGFRFEDARGQDWTITELTP